MKIALVHKRLDLRGGTERDFYRTAEGLRDLGHEVHLFCSEYGVKPPPDTVAHRIPVLPVGRTARLWSFALSAPAIIRACWRFNGANSSRSVTKGSSLYRRKLEGISCGAMRYRRSGSRFFTTGLISAVFIPPGAKIFAARLGNVGRSPRNRLWCCSSAVAFGARVWIFCFRSGARPVWATLIF